MEKSGVQRLAGVLKVLVTITFVCNLAALFLVPALVGLQGDWVTLIDGSLMNDPHEPVSPLLIIVAMWPEIFRSGVNPYSVLTVFLLFCGVCTAVILWQGRRVLDTILRADTFTFGNAANLRRAAVCCFLISGAALLRTVWGLFYHASPAPLLTYNALFCPIFLMGGLLCLVMSALFRQAAELKAENDLTI